MSDSIPCIERACYVSPFTVNSKEKTMNKVRIVSAIVMLAMIWSLANVSLAAAQPAPLESPLTPRWIPSKPAHTEITDEQFLGTIEVKFAEGSSYRLRQGEIVTLANDNLSALQSVMRKYPVKSVERLFTQPEEEISAEKAALEADSGEQMPDLNLWYRFTLSLGTNPEALIDALNALPEVEIAYPTPISSLPSGALAQPELATPSFVAQQGYLNAAPGGINAKYAWSIPGGTGSNVTIVDVEWGFTQAHEDFPAIPVVGGYMQYGDNHGTSVLGEMVAKRNSYGVTGIAYGAAVKFSSVCTAAACTEKKINVPDAINTARLNTARGDVILIEVHNLGVCGLADFYGPVEWYQANYNVIKMATASGRIVVEAAGNGHKDRWEGINLDAAGCQNVFNRNFRDSGAIIVGAGAPPNYTQPDRSRLAFSDFGSRVDVQGWGELVTSTGYGDLYPGSGPNQWYTDTFNGTSSASPIVAGAAAILSSIAQQRSISVTPARIRSILVSTGSPQQAAPGIPVSQHIGRRPNLAAAITQLVGFTSQFTKNAAGWKPLNGSWSITANGFYHTPGLANKYVSSMRTNNYPTLTYTVRMGRTGCSTCVNMIYFRGAPGTLTSLGVWNNGYGFGYSNSGYFIIWKQSGGATTRLVDWTASPAITGTWNTLKVTANGTFLQFFINNTLVASGPDSSFSTGKVGIGFRRDASAGNHFYVDWATLKTTAPAGDEGSGVFEEGILINELNATVPESLSGAGMAP
jgi:serine protease